MVVVQVAKISVLSATGQMLGLPGRVVHRKSQCRNVRELGISDPAGLSVTVVNGTADDEQAAVPQRAAAIVAALRQEGFTRAVASGQQDPHGRTQVTYPRSTGEQGRANALSVAKAVGIPGSQVRATDDVTTTLTIGSDWREGTTYPKQKAPAAGDLPDSADALSADKTECMDVYRPYRW